MKLNADLVSRVYVYLTLVIIISSVALVRYRLLDFPLERDEGEYAYMGQLILKGIPPYKLGYNMKLPGTYYMYALVMWFLGETTIGVHVGLLICNAFTMFLVFEVARRTTTTRVALIACSFYGWLSTSSTVMGFAGHATHYVVLMAMIATLILLMATKNNNYLLYIISGIFYGLCYTMKQHGIFFMAMGATIIVVSKWKDKPGEVLKTIIPFAAGVAFIVFALLILMYSLGVWENFWFWTVTYAADYESQVDIAKSLKALLIGVWYVTRSFFLVWILGAVGFVYLLVAKRHWLFFKDRFFIIIFAVFSFLTVVPGFYFRPHYFITFLPVVSLLAGIGVCFLISRIKNEKLQTPLLWAIVVTILSIGVFIERNYFMFEKSSNTLSYSIYTTINSFPETQRVAEFVKSNTVSSDRIFVFGSEPQIYFYSQRLSATGYLYMYPFVEHHPHCVKMQEEMISEVEKANPEFVIFVHTVGSWANKIQTLPQTLSWFKKYVDTLYEEVGIIDILADDKQISHWNKETTKTYIPLSNNFIKVFKRKKSIDILVTSGARANEKTRQRTL